MKGNDPEFVEALRLALKFFPESQSFLTSETGLDWDAFLGAMMVGNYSADYSCYPSREPSDPDFGFAAHGGFDRDDDVVYRDLLNHAGITPSGRAIVVLDAIGQTGQSTEDCPPFICHSRVVPERLTEIPCFGQCRDVIFIFESGEALSVDHDDRIHWSTSRENAPDSRSRAF